MLNRDGSIDRRHFGPFNVDRAPTGQFVSKGALKNPIEQYPDSKEKIRRETGNKKKRSYDTMEDENKDKRRR